ncbi:MAG TPA: xanthine dehydrogenase family protein molybdopterin-binding subunit [Stellaceae bacterium]|jgi:isoquinoline 1-oxidoreductase beta subunit
MSALLLENVSRRSFLGGLASAGGLVLAARIVPVRSAFADESAPKAYGAAAMPHGTVNDPHVFVSIANDGTVTIFCHRSEMGQGVRTGMPMIVADELEADWSRVKVAQAPGDEAKYGNQDTDGSRSTRHFMQPMRECGAAARMMLEAAAAKRWNVAASEVEAQNHEIMHKPSGRKLGYGDVASDAAALPVPARDKLKLKDPSQFRYIGKGQIPIVDIVDMTTGRGMYGIDTRLPGMLYAVVARPPVYGGKVKSFDGAEAMKIPGVVKLVPIEGRPLPSKFQPLGGVAVVARNTYAAIKGREALKIEWEDGPNASYDSKAYEQQLMETARKPAKVVRNDGDADAAFGKAATRIEAEYYIPHLAQAPMEPPSATAHVADGKCEAWACVQAPQVTRDEISQRLGLPESNVTVNVTLLGGAFGRKSKPDFVVEAALLSREMNAPVKVTWTREDDIKHGYYHTVSAERIEAALDGNGKPAAWRHRSVAPSIASIFGPDPKHEAPFEMGMGLVDLPFDIPNIRIENGEAAAHVRIGWFRSVANIPHAFAIQSFVGEIAAARKQDPKDVLLDLIGPPRHVDPRKSVQGFWDYGEDVDKYPIDTGRLRRVVELAAKNAGWGRQLPARHGLGIAAHRSFVTYVATVVEAAVDEKGTLSVPRVDVVVDCGAYVNPERIRSQIEGACIMGYSLATKGEITFEKGRAVQGNFDDYQVARIDEAPREINVHIVESSFDVPPGGVGEPGVPPFAPALANAIFAATGKRIRRLPIGDQLSA